MPAFLVPHRSGAHRVTAIALYRALISKCRSAPAAVDPPALVQIVRNSFSKHRHVTSKHILRDAFAAGYEALTHLNGACAGDPTSVSHIGALLAATPSKLRQPAAEPARPPRPPRPVPGAALAARPRPLHALKGRRRVPVLVSANRIPFLRLSKPQPEILSRYIKSRVVQRQRRHNRRHALEAGLQIAKAEDAWDALMRRCGVGRREKSWVAGVRDALDDVARKLEGEGEKNRAVAERMVAIVDGEKRLAESERKARAIEKNEQRRKRKEESK